MHLRKFTISNIRSIEELEMEFERGEESGWHVILGANGTGKSSVIRSLALLLMGEKEAYASRQDFWRWIRKGSETAVISGSLSMDEEYDSLSGGGQPPKRLIQCKVELNAPDHGKSLAVEPKFTGERHLRTIWGTGDGWFSASFGPFRRFTGGDRIYDRLFISNKRLAPHLTALGEDVALTEALSWLSSLFIQSLQDEKNGMQTGQATETLSLVKTFLNESGLLPHNACVDEITNNTVYVRDGNGIIIQLDQLSDGYRSALSLVIELIRQMFVMNGVDKMRRAFTSNGSILVPGVVAIDEVDAHLHPSWQKEIGKWLRKCFPRLQFIISTHSPLVCRAVADDDGTISGTIWMLPTPGSCETFRKLDKTETEQLAYGDVLDAYSTDVFGENVTRSQAGSVKVQRLAELNSISLKAELSDDEKNERKWLRSIFPDLAISVGSDWR